MDTDLVLDLFRRTSEEEDAAVAANKAKQTSGPISQKNLLLGLEDLPEDEYEGLDLTAFLGSLGEWAYISLLFELNPAPSVEERQLPPSYY